MNIDTQIRTDKEDKPLTRADVERLLDEAGSSDKLNLSYWNLKEVNLAGLDLHGANLRGANLSGANLSLALLSKPTQHMGYVFLH